MDALNIPEVTLRWNLKKLVDAGLIEEAGLGYRLTGNIIKVGLLHECYILWKLIIPKFFLLGILFILLTLASTITAIPPNQKILITALSIIGAAFSLNEARMLH